MSDARDGLVAYLAEAKAELDACEVTNDLVNEVLDYVDEHYRELGKIKCVDRFEIDDKGYVRVDGELFPWYVAARPIILDPADGHGIAAIQLWLCVDPKAVVSIDAKVTDMLDGVGDQE